MIDFNEITIRDKEIFDIYLKACRPQTSELTFTNFFMWRGFYKFRYAVVDDFLCIIAVPEKLEPFCFMPLSMTGETPTLEIVSKLGDYFASNGWKLRFERVDESQVKFFEGLGNDKAVISLDRDSSDYVYLAENMINLKGKKFDGKRNHINKFKKLYTYEYVDLEESYVGDCINIMERWCSERDCEEHGAYYCEKLANIELLKNFRFLGCKGALIKVDGKFEAFTVGEVLNDDTAVIHIEKANGAINGLYTFINQQFCEKQWNKCLYINREQDLGIEGLRKAKLSYNPERIVNKYTVVF